MGHRRPHHRPLWLGLPLSMPAPCSWGVHLRSRKTCFNIVNWNVWTHVEYMLNTCWIHVEYMLNTCWIHVESLDQYGLNNIWTIFDNMFIRYLWFVLHVHVKQSSAVVIGQPFFQDWTFYSEDTTQTYSDTTLLRHAYAVCIDLDSGSNYSAGDSGFVAYVSGWDFETRHDPPNSAKIQEISEEEEESLNSWITQNPGQILRLFMTFCISWWIWQASLRQMPSFIPRHRMPSTWPVMAAAISLRSSWHKEIVRRQRHLLTLWDQCLAKRRAARAGTTTARMIRMSGKRVEGLEGNKLKFS